MSRYAPKQKGARAYAVGHVPKPEENTIGAIDSLILEGYTRLAALLVATAFLDCSRGNQDACEFLQSDGAKILLGALDLDPDVTAIRAAGAYGQCAIELERLWKWYYGGR